MTNDMEIKSSVARSLRYAEMKTQATELAVETLGGTQVIWDRHGRGWYHALTAEAWAIVIALHDAGLTIVPASSSVYPEETDE
jgi:hypothetical protein